MVADGNKYWFEEDGTNGSDGGKNAGKDSWEALLGEEKETEEKGAADASGVSALQKLRKTLPPHLPRRRRPGLRIARHTKYGFRPCRAGQRPCAGRCFGR